jgi:predicted permease
MDSLLQDVKAALRALRTRKGMVALAVATLSLAIGANTSIFGVVHAVLLDQLPYRDPERLVIVWALHVSGEREVLSVATVEDYQAGTRTLERLAAWFEQGLNLTGEGDPERLLASRVGAGFFEVLGAPAALGRTFTPDEYGGGGAHVVVLSDALWRRRFGADPAVVGRQIRLADESYEVVGVMSPRFLFPGARAEMAVPLDLAREPRRAKRDDNFLRAIARLAPGVSRERAERQMSEVARELQARYPESSSRQVGVILPPLADEMVGSFRGQLTLLQAAVGLVLLIACVNLALLLLASASGRAKEMAVKAALGARRGRLARQLFLESLLIALAGGALGALLGSIWMRALVAMSPAQIPRLQQAHFGTVTLLFTFLAAAFTALLFGLGPALSVSQSAPHQVLGDGRSSSPPRALRVRRLLVVAEVALSVALLAVAGLMVRSFRALLDVEPGFRPAGTLSLRIALPPTRYPDRASIRLFQEQLRERLLSIPGVSEAGSVQVLPMSGALSRVDFTIAGQPPPRAEEVPQLDYRMVSPGYFRAAGVPLIAGRDLTSLDGSDAPAVGVVSRRLAERFFPGRSAVGERLLVDDGNPTPRTVEVVGVAGDVHEVGLEVEPGPSLYVPLPQVPERSMVYGRNLFWVVRSRGEPTLLRRSAIQALHAIDSALPASAVLTLDEVLARSVAPRRFNLLLVDLFALAAIVLAGLGVYAVNAQAVAQRRRELAIRLALGAAPRSLLRLVMAAGMSPVLAGIGLGLVGALALGRAVGGLLYHVHPADPLVLGSTSVVLVAVALLAVTLPARRATRADPIGALAPE